LTEPAEKPTLGCSLEVGQTSLRMWFASFLLILLLAAFPASPVPGGTRVFVANSGHATVSVIDADQEKEIRWRRSQSGSGQRGAEDHQDRKSRRTTACRRES